MTRINSILPNLPGVVFTDTKRLNPLTTKYHTLQPIPEYLIPAPVYTVMTSILTHVGTQGHEPEVNPTPDKYEIVTSVPVPAQPATAGGTQQPNDNPPRHLPWTGHLGCAVQHSSGRTLLVLPSKAELSSRPPAGGVKPASLTSSPDVIQGLGTALFRFQVDAHGMPIMSADGRLCEAQPQAPSTLEQMVELSPPVLSCLVPSCTEPARGPGGGPAATCSHAHFLQALQMRCPLYPNAQQHNPMGTSRLLECGFLDLLGDQPASSIPEPARQAVCLDSMHEVLKTAGANQQQPGDTLFDSAKPIPEAKRTARVKTTAKSGDTAKQSEARRIVSLCQVARETGRPLTLDILRPNQAFWSDFSEDTLQMQRPIASISKYSSTLNKLSGDLAELIGPQHPLHSELTANQGKPWHAEPFAQIQDDYANEVAARKAVAANAVANQTKAGPKRVQLLGPVDQPKDSQALAMPAYLLDEIIRAGLEEMEKREQLLARIHTLQQQTQQAKSTRSSTRKRTPSVKTPLPTIAKGTNPAQQHLRQAAVQQQIDDAEEVIGAAGICLLQFIYMARASTVSAAREYNPQGSIADDVQINERGMSYVIRFLKGWKPSTVLHGVRLPIAYTGPNTVPWDTDENGARANTRRNDCLRIIQAAARMGALATYECDRPEADAHRKITNAIQKVLNLQSKLRTADETRLGRSQKLTSHSIRRAAVTMAMHQGLSTANIIRWVYWKDSSMPYTYIDKDYEHSPAWDEFFTWMLSRTEQHA